MGRVRLLRKEHRADAIELCAQDPVAHVFVASRIARRGVERHTLGCDLWGWFSDGALSAMLHVGSNLVPVATDDASRPALAAKLDTYRHSNSIMGPAAEVLPLHEMLQSRLPLAYRGARDVRPRQPLMVCDTPPAVAADPRVQRIGEEHADAYLDAAVAMYTEEVGVSPVADGDDTSYSWHVDRQISRGLALGIVADGEVIFKSDIGAHLGHVCQVQGVWLAPRLRGRGLSAPAMAAVVELARAQHRIVSLYVNDYNHAALALYHRVGFRQVGEFATVLY